MAALFAVLGIYLGLALVVVYGIWRLIGRQGFRGLEDTDSPVARLFKRQTDAVGHSKPVAG